MVCNEFSVTNPSRMPHCAKPRGYIEKLSTAGVGAEWESNSENSTPIIDFRWFWRLRLKDECQTCEWKWSGNCDQIQLNTTEYSVQQLWIVSFRKSSGKSTMSYTSLTSHVSNCPWVFFASHLLEWTVEHLADIILLVAAPVLYKGTKTTAAKAAVQCGPLGLTEGRSGGHNVGVLQHRDSLRDLKSPETTEFLQKIY